MGFAQSRAALRAQLPPGPKNVLNVLAFYACEQCGHARPGVALLMLNTGLGKRGVQLGLEALRSRPDLLRVYRYPKGGRGVTTEYVVMPEVAKLSTENCTFLEKHSKTVHSVHGLTIPGPVKGALRGVKRVNQDAYHPSVQHHPSARAPASGPAAPAPNGSGVDPHNSPGPRCDKPIDRQPPTLPQSAAEACAEAIRVLTRGSHAMPGTGRKRKPEATP